MKILFVINSLATGGAEKLVVESVPKFVASGIDIEVLLLNGREFPFYTELKELDCCKINTLGKGSVYNPMLIFKIIPYLRRFDIVHVHLFPALYWVAIAKIISFSKVKLLFTEHSTSNRRRLNFWYRMADRIIYNQYTLVITISTEVKLFLKKHLGVKNTKFVTINNGVDFDKVFNASPSARKNFIKKEKDKIIIQVARFTNQKDHETLIKAIPYIKYPVVVLLVGEGPGVDKIKELANVLEVEDQVVFLGTRADVPRLLKMADIAVLSSNHEGLSLSGIEAMASGTPLVASKVLGLANLVHDAGLLFIHKDEIDLAGKINLLMSDPDYYAQTVASCLKRAKKFSLTKMVSEHILVYSKLCPNKN